jgi:hypothetical protein
MGGIFSNYAVEMGSGAVIYVSSFIKIASGIQELIRGGDKQTQIHTDCKVISYAYSIFQNKESRLKLRRESS